MDNGINSFSEGYPLPAETQIQIIDSFMERAKKVGGAAVNSLLEARFELQNAIDNTIEKTDAPRS